MNHHGFSSDGGSGVGNFIGGGCGRPDFTGSRGADASCSDSLLELELELELDGNSTGLDGNSTGSCSDFFFRITTFLRKQIRANKNKRTARTTRARRTRWKIVRKRKSRWKNSEEEEKEDSQI